MKTIILTTILAGILSITSLSAGTPKNVTYINVETTETGYTKEYVTYNEETSTVIIKVAYQYDLAGSVQNRTTYGWVENKGWKAIQKYDYKYNNKGQIDYIAFTKWDNKQKSWSNKCEQLKHEYNEEGKLMAVNKVEVNNNMDFMAQK